MKTNPYVAFNLQHSEPQPLISLDPDMTALAKWINELPRANINRSSWLIYNALNSLYEHRLSAKQWFKSLELFHPVVHSLCQSLRQYYLDQVMLSPKSKRSHMNKAQLLEMTLVQALWHLITTQHQQLDPTENAQIIHRGIQHCTQILLCSSQMYMPVPENLWHTLYRFYEFAIDHHLETIPLLDQDYFPGQATTISWIFKMPILLATCNLYQLPPRATEKVYESLSAWATKVRLNEPPEEGDRFVFLLGSDEPPMHRELMERKTQQARWNGVDTHLLLEHIMVLLEQLDHGRQQTHARVSKTDQGYTRTVLQHLGRAWGLFPQRSFARVPREGGLRICIGLAATHYFLTQGQDSVPNLLSKEAARNNRFNYRMHDWQLINSSLSGYCLCTAADFADELHVGEIIGLHEMDKNNVEIWYIGTIRWIKYTEDEELQMGVQLLAPAATPIGIRSRRQAEQQSDYLRALLLPKDEKRHQPATLVIPILPYREGDEVRIINESLDSDVRLADIVEQGSRYNQYTFTTVKHYGKPFEID